MYKKLICFVSVLIVIFTVFLVPVAAATDASANDTDIDKSSYINLVESSLITADLYSESYQKTYSDIVLPSPVFTDLYSANISLEAAGETNLAWNQFKEITFHFKLSTTLYINKLYFYLRSTNSSVQVFLDGNSVPLNYSGNANFTANYVNFSQRYVNNIAVKFTANSTNFVTQPFVLSIFAFDQLRYSPESVMWTYTDSFIYVDSDVDSGIRQLTEYGMVSAFPFSSIESLTKTTEQFDRVAQKRVRVAVDISTLRSDLISNFYFNFQCLGEALECDAFTSTVNLTTEGANPNPSIDSSVVDVLDVDITPYLTHSILSADIGGHYRYLPNGYLVNIDMSTIDAQAKYLIFDVVVEAVDAGDTGEDSIALFEMKNIYYCLDVYSDAFNSTVLAYLDKLNTTVFDGVSTFKAFYNDWKQYVTLDPDIYDKVSDLEDILTDQTSDIDDLLSELNGIERPPFDLSTVLSDVVLEPTFLTVFHDLLNTPLIYTGLILVVVFGFVGFILFGRS